MIDLGEIPPATALNVPPPAPGARWQRLVFAIAAPFVLLGTSSPPAATPMRLVATIPIGIPASVLVDGAEAFVVDGHDNRFAISVYAVVGGARRWSTPLDGSAVSPGLSMSPTTVMVTMPDTQTGSVLTEAYDRRTGVGLWSVAAYVGMTVPGDGVVMLGTFGGVGGQAGGTVVRLLDERTGVTRWSQTIPATCQVVYGGESVDVASGLVELCLVTGRLIVRDLATGEVRAERPVDVAPPGTRSEDGPPSVDLVGDLVLLTYSGRSSVVTQAYRAADLEPLWTDASNDDAAYHACGVDICRDGGDNPGRITVLDAQTGHEIAAGPLPLVPPAPEALPYFAPVGPALTTLVLLPPGALPGPPIPNVATDYVYPVPEAEVVHVPPAVDGTTWVARATDSGIEPIQRLAGVRADSCLQVAGYVMCAMPAGVLAVWRLPER